MPKTPEQLKAIAEYLAMLRAQPFDHEGGPLLKPIEIEEIVKKNTPIIESFLDLEINQTGIQNTAIHLLNTFAGLEKPNEEQVREAQLTIEPNHLTGINHVSKKPETYQEQKSAKFVTYYERVLTTLMRLLSEDEESIPVT